MQRVLIVSNRLPVTVEKRRGKLDYHPSTGGLVTGLRASSKSYKSIWIGWPGIVSDTSNNMKGVKEKLLLEEMYPVFLSKRDVKQFYEGFCNVTIWPLFHYFMQYAVYDNAQWEVYKHVNDIYCKKVLEIARKDDIIWIHDYHLMLLPGILREKLPDATIGFFLHIPFPSFEIFRNLPWRKEILTGILGSDLVGFHAYDYARHFLSAVNRILGIEHVFSQLAIDARTIRVDSFPMGIDYEKHSSAIDVPAIQKEVERYRRKMGDQKVILSIDRLDYSKGIIQRLEAFELFLEKNPEYREEVTMVLIAVPSRPKVPHYRELKDGVDKFVGQINGRFGTISWTPIHYFYRFLSFNSLSAFYNLADIALVTPLRDGMNLIAKEYIASRKNKIGVLILSEMTGASVELGDALIINPNNVDEIANALKVALTMPEDEQIIRNTSMQKKLMRYNIKRWTEDFVERLLDVKRIQSKMLTKRMDSVRVKELIDKYNSSERRLLFLDYDGTLVPFSSVPKKEGPDSYLLKLLNKLSKFPGNEVVMVSGRDKLTLQEWFGEISVGLVAEHGAWLREEGGDWEMIEPLSQDWKKEIRPILEFYVDRTPRSLVEEKEFSLVWHYRRTDSELGEIRARELVENLVYLTSNLDLQILEGSKIIEVKNSGVNKGRAALRWIERSASDFILAIGDDWTDEDIFKVLPEWAYSIKVGYGSSGAKYRIKSIEEVRSLLKAILKGGNK